MGAFYDEIPDDNLVEWILDQKIFWVATAPLAEDGHCNLSPKGSQAKLHVNMTRTNPSIQDDLPSISWERMPAGTQICRDLAMKQYRTCTKINASHSPL